MKSSDDELDDFQHRNKKLDIQRSVSASNSTSISNSFLDQYSGREDKKPKPGCSTNSIKISEKWKDATFVKTIQQRLECPLEIIESTLPAEVTSYNPQTQSPALSSSSPIDIDLPGGFDILILTTTDYSGGSSTYKRRLARFYKARKSSDSVVICARLADSQAYFNNVQNFCVIELGLPFIPVSENIDSQITQVILQLIDTSNPSKRRKNPFKFGVIPQNIERRKKCSGIIPCTKEQEVSKTLQTIPGLGEKKTRQLLQKFGSIYEISNQSAESLAKVVGVSTATSIYNFLNS